MKKTIIILLILLGITGCSQNNKEPEVENKKEYIKPVDEEVEAVEEEASSNIGEEEIMEEFLNMINPYTSARDLGEYIEEKIEYVGQENAEEMLKWLVIYQTEIIDDFNRKIYEPGYLEALNENMDGVLDSRKINNIEDEEIRSDYQNLVDSFLTIVKYGEHPVVETNWKRLDKFSSYVSENCREMIKLYDKIQNYEYNREELDIGGISQDIIKTENILGKEESKFIKEKLNQLYSQQIYALLVGPEGSYLDMWLEKSSEDYREIIKLIEIYPESILAEIISETNKAQDETMDVIGVLNKKLQFGLNSNKYIENVFFEKDNGEYHIIEIRIPENKEKQDSINHTIKKDIEEYLKEKQIDEDFNLNIFHNYEDERYISYEGILNYKDLQGNYVDTISFYRTLDYIDEEFITLEEYLNADFNTIKKDLERISGREINSIPDFLISYGGMDLYLEEGNYIDGYLNLTKKDLAPYFLGRSK